MLLPKSVFIETSKTRFLRRTFPIIRDVMFDVIFYSAME